MNKPKTDIGYSQEIIDYCAKDAPHECCKECMATKLECVSNQREAKQALEQEDTE